MGKKGIGWGEAKESLFQVLERNFVEKTKLYNELISDQSKLHKILADGAERARAIAQPLLAEVKKATLG